MLEFLKGWRYVLVGLAALILVVWFGYDPIGNFVEERFGVTGPVWAVDIILVVALVVVLLHGWIYRRF